MLQMRTIDVTDRLTPDLKAYASAMRDGFHEAPITDEGWRVWHEAVSEDGTRLRAVYDDERPFGLADRPVGTFASFPGTLNTGTELAPANCITDVTVAASHRRRGIMQQMMRADLAEAKGRGDVFAALTATDTRIYGRFGFGVSADARRIEIDASHGFSLLRDPVGTCVFADPDAVAAIRRDLFERWHAAQFWSLTRHHHYWQTGFDWATQTKRADRPVVHLDADGNPDGVAMLVIRDDHIEIRDLLGLTHEAEIELIGFIALLEMYDKVVWLRSHDPRHPLPWAVGDRRSVSVTKVTDSVWVRIMDVHRALAARSYYSDGEAVVRVIDPLDDDQSGTYRVHVEGGRAEVEETAAEPDATLPLSSLAPIYSGLIGPVELAAAGRAEGTPEGLARVEHLFDRDKPGVSASIF